jgi:type II secretory pathway component PulC
MVKKTNFLLIIILIFTLTFSLTALAQEEEKENLEELYEGKEFRNPFLEYTEPEPVPQQSAANAGTASGAQEPQEPVITFEMVRNGLPFNLSGIISSNRERIALLNTGDGTEFIRGYYKEDGYELIDIQADSVIVRNRGFRLRLKIGGEIDEI